MNTFSKIFLLILGIFIGLAGVLQLQNIAFELMSSPNDGLFYLGIFYLAIVIFIWVSTIYLAADYLIKLKNKKDQVEQETSNEQKPNN
jgi:TRAP-type C4-dicarboxylate transport system permease small subunit